MSGQPAIIQLKKVRPNPVALRTVNHQSETYEGIRDSIKEKGILNPPSVRRKEDPETHEEYYELIDGLHRYTAALEVGLVDIPVLVLDFNDAQVLEAQIVANLHNVKTSPSQFTKQLKRILAMNPLMTESELAQKLGCTIQFIQQRLSLVNIENVEILKLVDDGKIPLTNSYALAKLPTEEQQNFLEQAMTMKPDEFIPLVNARVKELKEARRQGKEGAEIKFEPVAHLQKISDIKSELNSGAIGKVLCKKHKLNTAIEGFSMALNWVLHMDPQSVEAQKTKFEAAQKEREDARKKRLVEQAEKKKAKAEKEAKEAAEAVAKAEEALKK